MKKVFLVHTGFSFYILDVLCCRGNWNLGQFRIALEILGQLGISVLLNTQEFQFALEFLGQF